MTSSEAVTVQASEVPRNSAIRLPSINKQGRATATGRGRVVRTVAEKPNQ
jgi:hypothetical protein